MNCLINVSIAPLRLFRPIGNFVISSVKVDTIRPNEFMHTIGICRRLVFDNGFNDPMIRICRFLIVPVRGIGLRSFSTRFKVILTCVFRITNGNVMAYPGSRSCVLLPNVNHRLFWVGFQCGLRGIDLRISDPTFVRGRVLSTVPKNRISVIRMYFVICSDFRVRTFSSPVIPPFPNRFTQACP